MVRTSAILMILAVILSTCGGGEDSEKDIPACVTQVHIEPDGTAVKEDACLAHSRLSYSKA